MSESVLYGGTSSARVRVHHLQQAKERGEKWAMLTAYDMYTAEIFDEAGIPVLLVGDSAGNNVYGFETTVPVTVDHLVPLCRAVTSSAKHAMVVADLPFGSYQASPQQEGRFRGASLLENQDRWRAITALGPDAPHGVAHPAEADRPLTGWHS